MSWGAIRLREDDPVVDRSQVLVDGAIDAAGLYVPMTRGRDGNDVWVVTDPTSPADAVDMLAEAMQRRRIDEPAIERLTPRRLPRLIALSSESCELIRSQRSFFH